MLVKDLADKLVTHFGSEKLNLDAFMQPMWNYPDPTVQYINQDGSIKDALLENPDAYLFHTPGQSYFYTQPLIAIRPLAETEDGRKWICAVAKDLHGTIRTSMTIGISTSETELEGFVSLSGIEWCSVDGNNLVFHSNYSSAIAYEKDGIQPN